MARPERTLWDGHDSTMAQVRRVRARKGLRLEKLRRRLREMEHARTRLGLEEARNAVGWWIDATVRVIESLEKEQEHDNDEP